MSVKEEERKSLEEWLDRLIDAHRHIWENGDFVLGDKKTGIYTREVPNQILIRGVEDIAEILECKVKKSSIFMCTRVTVDYKGVELVENLY